MVSDDRRAPVQGDLYPHRPGGRREGSIAWSEHVEAWNAYAAVYGRSQSAERIAERGGFGHGELLRFLGRDPATFRPSEVRR